MWKYKFILIGILNIAPWAIRPHIRPKRKELNEALSDIFKKRKEYEKSLMSDYTTTTAYKIWAELIKDKELEICHIYVGLNSSEIHRSVVSTHARIVELHFKEIKDHNEKEFDAVLVTILQCRVSPLFHRRSHINFMRSCTADCLYVVNQLSQSGDKFYIAGEVCLSGKYNFMNICLADAYESSRERKRKIYQQRDDSIDERRQYELNHLKDYTLKPEKHKQWPELKGEDMNKFCSVLAGHLSPRDIFLRIGRVHTVLIYYKQIRDTNYEVPQTVDVGALLCEIPEKKQSDNYNFIRAAAPNCVYLIRRINPRRIKPTCYISKQFCGAPILQFEPTITDTQFYENRDMDFPYGTEFVNSLDENIHYEETEILSFDRYHNKIDSHVDTGKVTEQAVASHIDTDINPLENCISVNMMEPNKAVNRSFRQKKRAIYEENHMKNYINAPDKYERWPELNKENEMEICRKYTETLFLYNPRSVLSTHTRNVWLQYQEIEDNHQKIQPTLIILALACQIFPKHGNRKFIYFIKSPTPNCLYLSNHLNRSSQRLYIIDEVCLNKEWIMPYDIFQTNMTYKRQHNRWHDDEPLERREYENNHFKDHKLKTIEYRKWPLMKEGDMVKRCRVLLNQLFPKNQYTEFNGEDRLIELKYIEIRDDVNEEFAPLKLGALRCQWPQKKQKSVFQFIRSPRTNCVYLVKKITARDCYHYISKQICEDQVLRKRDKTMECLNSGTYDSSVDQCINTLFDEGTNSENEIFMELDDIEDL